MFSRLILVALICGAAWAFPQTSFTAGGSASASGSGPAIADVPTITTPAVTAPTVPSVGGITTPEVTTLTVPSVDGITTPVVTAPTIPSVPVDATAIPVVTMPTVPSVPTGPTVTVEVTTLTVTPPTVPSVDVSTVPLTTPSAESIAQYMERRGGYIKMLADALKTHLPDVYSQLSDATKPLTVLIPPPSQLAQMFNAANSANLLESLQQFAGENILKGLVAPTDLTPLTNLQNINGLPIRVRFGVGLQLYIGRLPVGLGSISLGSQAVLQVLG